jgi:hypothetical protein
MGKLVALAQVGLLVSVLGSGCSLVPSEGPVACVDWVRFETAQDQYDKAGVVLGDPGDGNLRISSMPPTCIGGVTYPDGDPLDPNQRAIIFAIKQGGD